MNTQTILIADDDPRLIGALTVRLEAEGFRVVSTSDAYQALALAVKEQPDLLLLDVNMPAGNGFSVQERIAKIPELVGTPVVFITGEAPEAVDQTAADLGAVAVVHKPFTTEELLDAIRGGLGYWVIRS